MPASLPGAVGSGQPAADDDYGGLQAELLDRVPALAERVHVAVHLLQVLELGAFEGVQGARLDIGAGAYGDLYVDTGIEAGQQVVLQFIVQCVFTVDGLEVHAGSDAKGGFAGIGRHFLDAGLGWGGSCFPKDVQALAYMAKEKGLNPRILNNVMEINYDRRKAVLSHLEHLLGGGVWGKMIGLLGLAFKPNTDDMRDAPSVEISNALIAAGARVRGYDPVARETAAPLMPDVEICNDVYEMADGCDALVVVTEWNEFKQLDLEKLKGLLKSPVIYDGRNIYDPELMKAMGFSYRAIGRGIHVNGVNGK